MEPGGEVALRVCARVAWVPFAFVLAVVCLHTSTSHAAWLETSSDHFIIYSDSSARWARDFASRLEKYDSAIRRVFPPKMEDEEARRSNRLRVYVVPSENEVQKLAGGGDDSLLGFYLARAGGSVAFTPRRTTNESRTGYNASNVLLHEYAHHFMFSNFKGAYPAWFAEGFAEFCSGAEFASNGSINFGMPPYGRIQTLLHGAQIPARQLMDVTAEERNRDVQAMLYARGWLLTHFLKFDLRRRGQLTTYLTAFNSGMPSVDAARAAFGDLQQLDEDLNRHMQRRLGYVTIQPGQLTVGDIALRTLGEGESAMMPVRMRSIRGVTESSAYALIPQARRIARRYPDDPLVQAQLAEAEFDAKNLLEAEAAVDRSLARDPRNFHALLYKGHILASRAAHSKDPADWRAARAWYVKASGVDPDCAQALTSFYDELLAAGMPPSANAIAALSRAIDLTPEAAELSHAL